MAPRPRDQKYVEELTERLRQNLASGAALDDIVLALGDACARRAVDESPAVSAQRAAMIATNTYAAQKLRDLVGMIRSTHKEADRAARRQFKPANKDSR